MCPIIKGKAKPKKHITHGQRQIFTGKWKVSHSLYFNTGQCCRMNEWGPKPILMA